MPSNDATSDSGDRLDPFLIAEPAAVAPRVVAGLDDFLAVPPIPAEPTAPEADAGSGTASASHKLPTVTDVTTTTTTASRLAGDEAFSVAVPPILASFPPEQAEPSAVARGLNDIGPSLIAPPNAVFPNDDAPDASRVARLATEVEQGGGGDVLSALATNPLNDELLADPSPLLSASPLASPAVADGGSANQFDPWSSDSSWSGRVEASQFGPGRLDSDPSDSGSTYAWGRGDDRSSAASDAVDRIENRLSQVVGKLESVVASLSAPGPSPLGSRPRGFRGRIDA